MRSSMTQLPAKLTASYRTPLCSASRFYSRFYRGKRSAISYGIHGAPNPYLFPRGARTTNAEEDTHHPLISPLRGGGLRGRHPSFLPPSLSSSGELLLFSVARLLARSGPSYASFLQTTERILLADELTGNNVVYWRRRRGDCGKATNRFSESYLAGRMMGARVAEMGSDKWDSFVNWIRKILSMSWERKFWF